MIPMYMTILFFLISNSSINALTVCNNFEDYFNPNERNCYDYTEAKLNTTEIIRRWGFHGEEEYLTTQDGYKILLNRAYLNITKENPILLLHGISMNSLGFVYRDKKSLPYILGKLGYDVYIINVRGTIYSRDHVRYSANDSKYWKFSFHEMAIYELRQTLDLIFQRTNQKVILIGFSMGSTMSYIYSSIFSEEAKVKVQGMMALAPVVYLTKIRSLFGRVSSIWPLIKKYVYLTNHGELNNPIMPDFCNVNVFTMFACVSLTAFLFGDDYNQQMDPVVTPTTFEMSFDSIGAEVATHYVQIMISEKFQYYDFGKTKNMELYHQLKPPEYNLSKIPIPVSLFVGANDWLAMSNENNARKVYKEINIKCGYNIVPWKKWCHNDFVSAKDIDKYLYKYVIEKIYDIENDSCVQ